MSAQETVDLGAILSFTAATRAASTAVGDMVVAKAASAWLCSFQ